MHVFDTAAPVRPRHYTPDHHPLNQVDELAQRHGIGHLVLVQPSVYGTDNSLLMRALAEGQGRHRGVVVVDAGIGSAELERMHAAGVRGVRFNLVSPAGYTGDLDADLGKLAPCVDALGWHVQWYSSAGHLPHLLELQRQTGLRFVFDHLAGLHAGLAADDPAWAAAAALAEGGAWIKLSGWYRLGAVAPYRALWPHIGRLAQMFGPNMVWGSDWPHTSFVAQEMPVYGATLAPVRQTLEVAQVRSLLFREPERLYG